MPYPDSLLSPDEEVVQRMHPHWITLVAPALIFIVDAGLGAFLAAIVPSGGAQAPLRWAIVAVCVIVLVWFVVIPLLRWRTTHYVITTHRVLIRTGILSHSGHDIPLQRVNDVSFRQSLFDRLLGAGSLTVESAGEHGQERLANIPHSDRVQQLLNRLIEEDAERRGRYAVPGYEDEAAPRGDEPWAG